jgi:xanthine dehydrogenase YagS FAD-binding subunit
MSPFAFERAADAGDALRRIGPGAQFVSGGTTMVDLIKLGVLEPSRLVGILNLRAAHGAIRVEEAGASIGALATMAEVAAHPAIRARWTAAAEALDSAASAQIRNAATIGGTLLQRTRCSYFRDAGSACNKRRPGSGCAALAGGHTRDLAILGTSPHCIANYPGDLAVALVALDAAVTLLGTDGTTRSLGIEDLHREPGDRPDLDTVLAPGELILAVHLPDLRWDRPAYLKLRDRGSHAFALASLAVSLRLEDGRIADLRVMLGGLASRPWRCRAAEDAVRGRVLDPALAERAAELCLEDAEADPERDFKLALGRRLVARALLAAGSVPPNGGGDAR